MNRKEILYIVLPDFAEHEMVYLAQGIACDDSAIKQNPKFINKVVAPSMEPIKSIGGFRMLPDYTFDTMPNDYAALVLIGGFGWSTPLADKVAPLVKTALESGKIVLYATQPHSWQSMDLSTMWRTPAME